MPQHTYTERNEPVTRARPRRGDRAPATAAVGLPRRPPSASRSTAHRPADACLHAHESEPQHHPRARPAARWGGGGHGRARQTSALAAAAATGCWGQLRERGRQANADGACSCLVGAPLLSRPSPVAARPVAPRSRSLRGAFRDRGATAPRQRAKRSRPLTEGCTGRGEQRRAAHRASQHAPAPQARGPPGRYAAHAEVVPAAPCAVRGARWATGSLGGMRGAPRPPQGRAPTTGSTMSSMHMLQAYDDGDRQLA
jgi:hypothetical protein